MLFVTTFFFGDSKHDLKEAPAQWSVIHNLFMICNTSVNYYVDQGISGDILSDLTLGLCSFSTNLPVFQKILYQAKKMYS